MKKNIPLLTVVILCTICLIGCSSSGSGASDASGLKIVTTIFPEYDWVMNVLGDNPADIEVTMLLENGVDLHSFQPTVDDILKISSCDMFVYVGGESDKWVEDALKEAANKDMIVIDLLDVLGDSAKEEETVEGMQEEDHDHQEDESDETEYDEHVWLSLKNAVSFTEVISKAVQELDPDHAGLYRSNSVSYTEKLNALDVSYLSAVSGAPVRTVLFADRFPFRYLTEDYGLDYYAAFSGCSAETEASFETITFLARKTDELSLPAVLTIEGTDHRIAETILSNTRNGDLKILTMDSMQAVTSKDVSEGTTYISIMENNLEVLKEALY